MGYLKSNGVASFSLLILQIYFHLQPHFKFGLAWYPNVKEGYFSDPNTFLSENIAYEGNCKERCERNRGGGPDHFLLNCFSNYVSQEETVLCLSVCSEQCPPKYCQLEETILCKANTEIAEREAEEKRIAEEKHQSKINGHMDTIETLQAQILILVVTLVPIVVAGMAGVFGVYLYKQRKKPPKKKYNDQVLKRPLEDTTNHSTESSVAATVSSSNIFNHLNPSLPLPQPQPKDQSIKHKSAGGKRSLETKGAQKQKKKSDFRKGQGPSASSASTATHGTTASSSDISFYQN